MGKTRILVDCIDQRLVITNDPLLASGGQNEDEIEFSFCPLWDGFGKTAVFYRTPAEVYNSSIVNNRCIIPAEVLVDKGEIFFGVFGSKGDAIRTTEVIKYNVVQGALLSGKKPAEPTPDIYIQLMTRLGEIEQRAVNAVQRTGDTMTGDLHLVGKNVYANQLATNATDETPIFVLLYGGSDSVTLQANNRDWSSDNWLRLYRDMTVLGKPLNIASGGTGAKDLAGLQSILKQTQILQPGPDLDLLSLSNGWYHLEGAASREANNWPYDSGDTRAEVVVFGNRNGDNGFYLVVVIEMWGGTMYINRRTWSSWSGWQKIATEAVD